jgi:chemotaxis protein methyltransferase CheR
MASNTIVVPPSGPAEARISDQEFDLIRKLVYKNFGINLTDQKKTLVVGRLQKVLRDRKFSTFKDYYQWLTHETTGEGLDELANRISTNHTFFNREKAHFEFFAKTVLPEIQARRQQQKSNEVRIWCAGCSSGEEPYTLMMLIMEHFKNNFSQWNPMLLATDISATALKTAMAGVYPNDRVDQLPAALRNKYFNKQPDGSMVVKDEVRKRIFFRRHNLMDATFPFKKEFDTVFCRNVMIYFDRQTRNTLVAKYHKHTAQGGYLFIGHSETLGRDETDYNYVMPAVYKK